MLRSQIRKILLSTLLSLTFSISFATPVLPFNKIVFFGDSLSDNGNLFRLDAHFLPQSPPYFHGRFSNGRTWAEWTAIRLNKLYHVQSANYAVGGATALLHSPLNYFVPYSLKAEVSNYLIRNFFYSKDKTLFVIWIGCNDYLLTDNNVDQATTAVISAIRAQINRLAAAGGRNFVIINLPDISRSPSAVDRNVAANLHALVLAHNAKLKIMLNSLQNRRPDLKIIQIDAYDPFNQLLDDPQAFNQQFGTHITDVKDPCWQGAYGNPNPNENEISAQLNQATNQANLNTNQWAAMIQNSPSLQEAYMVAQSYASGETACSNPNSHVFWDHVHPTEPVHRVIANIIFDDIVKVE